MPQLLPDPWFFIIMVLWTIILLVPFKILSHTFMNTPNLKHSKTSFNQWLWPWQ
uniref:ATP synthase F0 subunit 8 n=1 Tax=Gracixalus yunnanensis TaxID=2596631 RepID=UPI001F13C31B|nr:ATP synthase F0 subunit 8 [Gracixalus yunnanensis]UMI33287.1 ATP synthase F0 subunit 8 [Gracixalus yunnanensis]